MHRPDRCDGFTLVELLLAASLGSLLFGVLLQLLLGDLRLGAAMAARLQARSQQQRTLALLRAELAMAHGVDLDPYPSAQWPCGLAGRRPVLAIATDPADPDGRGRAIVYSVGSAPSSIWRGQVLMRCGPAYSLDGLPSLESRFQNRVLLDSMPEGAEAGLIARRDPVLPVLHLALEQALSPSGRVRTTAAL